MNRILARVRVGVVVFVSGVSGCSGLRVFSVVLKFRTSLVNSSSMLSVVLSW